MELVAQALYANFAAKAPRTSVKLGELCILQEGYFNPSQQHPEYFDGGIKWLRAVDINGSFIFKTSRTLTAAGYKSAGKSALLFKPDTIAISESGTIGRLGFVLDFMCGNRAVINVEPREPQLLPLVFLYLKSRQPELLNLAVGCVQKNLYVPILQNLEVAIPEGEDIRTFCIQVRPLFDEWKTRVAESLHLAELRDTLLTRLMSGELSVSEISDAKG